MKKGTVIAWLFILFSGVAAFFWYYDWKYSLPTPVPENYKAVNAGVVLNLPASVKENNGKPLFLHFFNPSCPCSRFNMAHFKSLVKQHSGEVNFKIVVMSDKEYTAKDIQDKFDLQLPVLFDTALATTCGVYSTPQAVIINSDQELFYRGNYNRSRYCSDKKTEYARVAIEGLLQHNPVQHFDQFALKAYGCQLPRCTK